MAALLPVVRHILICEDIRVDPANPQRVSLLNLIGVIRSLAQPPFPFRYPEFCVYVQLTECRGGGDVRLEIEEADTGTSIFQTLTRTVSLGNDPLKARGLPFRIRNCSFPSAGLYWLQFWYNNIKLDQEPFVLG
jgi:hypothetical protein